MTKPLHAGRAAATGVTAARLAKRGFASRSDILEAPQGFGATQSDAVGGRVFAIGTPPPQRIHVSTTAGQLHGVSRITSALLEADFARARQGGLRVASSFRNVFGGVETFEDDNDLRLPSVIKTQLYVREDG